MQLLYQQNLEAKLQEKAEEMQLQAATLNEHHQHKMAALKAKHQGEITKLQAELADGKKKTTKKNKTNKQTKKPFELRFEY